VFIVGRWDVVGMYVVAGVWDVGPPRGTAYGVLEANMEFLRSVPGYASFFSAEPSSPT